MEIRKIDGTRQQRRLSACNSDDSRKYRHVGNGPTKQNGLQRAKVFGALVLFIVSPLFLLSPPTTLSFPPTHFICTLLQYFSFEVGLAFERRMGGFVCDEVHCTRNTRERER